MGAVFFFVDQRLERGMLVVEGLDLGLIHRSHSFLCNGNDSQTVKHEFSTLSRLSTRPVAAPGRIGVDRALVTRARARAKTARMNDDDPRELLALLKTEHRRLDEEIDRACASRASADQLELARLKKRKLRLKDEIQHIADRIVPDIIA